MFGDPDLNNKGWPVQRVNEIGQCIAGATPSTKIREYWDGGTIPWLSSGEINKGRIFETDSLITEVGYEATSTKLIPPHTVVMALAGQGKTRGKVAVAEISLCTNQSICSIVTDKNKNINVDFLYAFLQTQYDNLRVASNGDGGRGGLNLKIVGDYKVICPPVSLQNQFSDFVKLIDKSKFVCYSRYFL
jgi:type I restriction enzyme S subunit